MKLTKKNIKKNKKFTLRFIKFSKKNFKTRSMILNIGKVFAKQKVQCF